MRLDFFGDEVERLTTFDIANQRSLHDLDRALVAPAREWMPGAHARERAARPGRGRARGAGSTFDRLADGHLFDGMEGWMPLFVARPRTLLDDSWARPGASWSSRSASRDAWPSSWTRSAS